MQERGKETTKSTSKRLLVKLSKVLRPNVQKRVEQLSSLGSVYPFYTCILPIVIAIESSGLSRKKINTYLHNYFDDVTPPFSSSSTYLELTPLSE